MTHGFSNLRLACGAPGEHIGRVVSPRGRSPFVHRKLSAKHPNVDRNRQSPYSRISADAVSAGGMESAREFAGDHAKCVDDVLSACDPP
jgi:hypothetical protein